jgi:hypothetical protein
MPVDSTRLGSCGRSRSIHACVDFRWRIESDERAKLLDRASADALDLHQILDAPKATDALTFRDDGLRFLRANAG